MISLNLSVIALCLLGGGILGFLLGGILVMTFDIGSWMPTAGQVLIVLSGAAILTGLIFQCGAWIYT